MNPFRRLFGRKDAPQRAEDIFAASIIAALRERDTEIQVEYDPQEFELRHVDELARGQKTMLYNSFVEYERLDTIDREKYVNRVVDFILNSRVPAPTGEAALNQLLPVLRARADMLAVAASFDRFPYDRCSRPFCGTMLLMLAIDSETSISLVTDEVLDDLGVSFDDALGIAIAHLDELGNHSFGSLGEGTFVSTCEDHYDASRILIPDLITQLPLKGNPVVIVQARSAILITGSDDHEGLEMIARYALEDFPNNERAVSLTPIEWREGKWQPFQVEEHHPLSLRNLLPSQLSWSYGATAPVLQKQIEDRGEDFFVANVMVVQKDGRYATGASWAAGVPTACPLVDAIFIQGSGEFPEMVRSLADVLKVCGPFEEIEAMPYPPRWLLPASIDEAKRRELTDEYPDHQFFPSNA